MSDKKIARKTKIGSVVSNKMDKSVVVQVDRRIRHKLYGKFMRKSVKYMADDPNNVCNIGDVVLIDGLLVNGSAKLVAWFSSVVRHVQTGLLYHYAFAMIIGVLMLLTLFVII